MHQHYILKSYYLLAVARHAGSSSDKKKIRLMLDVKPKVKKKGGRRPL